VQVFRLLIRLLPLSALFFIATLTAIFVGHQQSQSAWAQLLHLDECELPCWIGIVPGETTLGEAQKQLERVYANKTLYVLEGHQPFPDTASFHVKHKITGETLGVALIGSVINEVSIFPYVEEGFHSKGLTTPDLYNALGTPAKINLYRESGSPFHMVNLLYIDQHVWISISDLRCYRVSLMQAIDSLVLYAQQPIPVYDTGIETQQWQGFNRCYHFK
jgi:hypothetical protein